MADERVEIELAVVGRQRAISEIQQMAREMNTNIVSISSVITKVDAATGAWTTSLNFLTASGEKGKATLKGLDDVVEHIDVTIKNSTAVVTDYGRSLQTAADAAAKFKASLAQIPLGQQVRVPGAPQPLPGVPSFASFTPGVVGGYGFPASFGAGPGQNLDEQAVRAAQARATYNSRLPQAFGAGPGQNLDEQAVRAALARQTYSESVFNRSHTEGLAENSLRNTQTANTLATNASAYNYLKLSAIGAGVAVVGLATKLTSDLVSALHEGSREAAQLSIEVGQVRGLATNPNEFTSASILKRSGQLGISSHDVARGTYQALQSQLGEGSAGQNLFQGAGFLSTIEQSSFEGNIKTLTAALHGFNIEQDSAALVAAKFAKASELGNFQVGELGPSLGTLAGLASHAGVSLDEVLAVLVKVTRNGGSAGQTVTELINVLKGFIKPSKDFQSFLTDTGAKSGKEFIQASGGIIGALNRIKESVGESGAGIEKFFVDIRELRGFFDFTKNGVEDLVKTMGSLSDESIPTLVKRLTEIRTSSGFIIKQTNQELTNAFTSFGQSLNEAVAPELKQIAELLNIVSANSTGAGDALRSVGANTARAFTFGIYGFGEDFSIGRFAKDREARRAKIEADTKKEVEAATSAAKRADEKKRAEDETTGAALKATEDANADYTRRKAEAAKQAKEEVPYLRNSFEERIRISEEGYKKLERHAREYEDGIKASRKRLNADTAEHTKSKLERDERIIGSNFTLEEKILLTRGRFTGLDPSLPEAQAKVKGEVERAAKRAYDLRVRARGDYYSLNPERIDDGKKRLDDAVKIAESNYNKVVDAKEKGLATTEDVLAAERAVLEVQKLQVDLEKELEARQAKRAESALAQATTERKRIADLKDNVKELFEASNPEQLKKFKTRQEAVDYFEKRAANIGANSVSEGSAFEVAKARREFTAQLDAHQFAEQDGRALTPDELKKAGLDKEAKFEKGAYGNAPTNITYDNRNLSTINTLSIDGITVQTQSLDLSQLKTSDLQLLADAVNRVARQGRGFFDGVGAKAGQKD